MKKNLLARDPILTVGYHLLGKPRRLHASRVWHRPDDQEEAISNRRRRRQDLHLSMCAGLACRQPASHGGECSHRISSAAKRLGISAARSAGRRKRAICPRVCRGKRLAKAGTYAQLPVRGTAADPDSARLVLRPGSGHFRCCSCSEGVSSWQRANVLGLRSGGLFVFRTHGTKRCSMIKRHVRVELPRRSRRTWRVRCCSH
jgi:hypothetical protein